MPLCTHVLCDSLLTEESDNTVQESTPLVWMGMVATLRELLFPICECLLWLPNVELFHYSQKHTNYYPYEDPNDQLRWFSIHLLVCASLCTIQAYSPFTNMKMINKSLIKTEQIGFKIYLFFPFQSDHQLMKLFFLLFFYPF